MTTFKVGDKVRITEKGANDCVKLLVGATGTVRTIKDDKIVVDFDEENHYTGYDLFAYRFELVNEDEELASKYRELRKECRETYDKLVALGYSVKGIHSEIKIFKNETIEEEEIVKKIVTKVIRKEI